MTTWKRIIVHHSASEFGTRRLIDEWHYARGFNGCGYHFVVLNGILTGEDWKAGHRFLSLVGSIECGRPIDGDRWVEANEVGAHALGLNADSIGICLIHDKEPHGEPQLSALYTLCRELCVKFNISPEDAWGHYEVDKKKPLCPGIDMAAFRAKLKEL